MAKHVLRYVKGTLDQSLIFKRSDNPLQLISFCDGDWGNSADRKSVTGYIFQLASDGPVISWKSRKQQTVALSTCKAEYMSMAAARSQICMVNDILFDQNDKLFDQVTLFCNNKGAIALAKNPVLHQRSKHIDIKYHFIGSEVQKGVVKNVYVPSEQNVADILNKPLAKSKLQKFVSHLMGCQ
ncbi:Copia protein [Holothuria leucospilota]|uniref:Copia protein n=1 Tax=Holothuria leucospilota TaxID=206669 RepID=A0A9Q1CEV6_HOLLE|nr:Copia protein [Holothuria leucospilota]